MSNGDVYKKTGGVYSVVANIAGPTGPAGAAGSNASVLISEQILGADAASVVFSAIPGTYRHLRLLIYGRLTEATANDYVYVQFNADTGSNYDYQHWYMNNATQGATAAYAQGSVRIGDLPAANSARSTQAGVIEAFIPHYAGTSFEKILNCVGGGEWGTSGTNMDSTRFTGFWRSAAAITRIDVLPTLNNFKAGSLFSLYGLT